MSEHSSEEIARHVKIYIIVFVTLLVLTLVTVAVSYLHVPIAWAITIAMIIATIKGSLVACYFMHLLSERRLILVVLAMTVFLFAVLMLLPSLDVSASSSVGAA